MSLHYEWDQNKAVTNLQKHHVDFKEACTVFGNPLARIFDDEVHSLKEQREIIVGHSITGRLLVIVFTERSKNVVRIISARKATKRERNSYEEKIDIENW
jgi:uncharacterized protein